MSPYFKLTIAAIVSVFAIGTCTIARAEGPSLWAGDFYAELGVTKNTSLFQSDEQYEWEDQNSPGFYGSIRYEVMLDRDRLGLVLFYSHFSQWLVGPPFEFANGDDNGESSLDSFGFAVRWRLTGR